MLRFNPGKRRLFWKCKIMSIISLSFFGVILLIIGWLLRTAKTTWEVILAVAAGFLIVLFTLNKMTWIYINISRDFNPAVQRCVGRAVEEGKCFGIVQNLE